MAETEQDVLTAAEGWDVAPTQHNPAALCGPLQDIARQFRVMARVMSGVPADVDEQSTPIHDQLERENEDRQQRGDQFIADCDAAIAEVSQMRTHRDLAPSPATRMAWAVGAFLALAFVVVLVLTGLGWS